MIVRGRVCEKLPDKRDLRGKVLFPRDTAYHGGGHMVAGEAAGHTALRK